MAVIVSKGFAQNESAQIAAMYWDAFGQKLGRVMGPESRSIAFIESVLDPTHAICARDETGVLLGVAGFKTFDGALVGGTWRDLARHYGWIGSTWRVGLLALLERDTENERFLMDGVFVHENARGKGVGTALLNGICDEARDRGYKEVRLDVIDTNPRARALYERKGFVAGESQNLGPLRFIFGFKSATIMIRQT
ncbi:Acetyltransferase (GNAT) family protein [Octadecabacter temperatus]|uniref:Putative acetyltransferase n=1 Tax=Octadecabacter temperatus TaxID=1458307 RepID=A0A0K0Y906_9RHOB|nr:GNAT family N-acetyltransferase [Octadecabacter temperatus]AKS47449.1 putative acetyltransferase [Octadecabacter temperatus]SIO42579.1 Acetyltransferase (GNAT) family protein [Octadecabacter temperatus]